MIRYICLLLRLHDDEGTYGLYNTHVETVRGQNGVNTKSQILVVLIDSTNPLENLLNHEQY